MNILKKLILWNYMLAKRLLHKYSIIILLCCIPLMAIAANGLMSGSDAGVLNIALCSEDKDTQAVKIIDGLLAEKSIIRYQEAESVEAALKMLENFKVDAVWHFHNDFDTKAEEYVNAKKGKPFMTVYEREETIPLRLSREKLYGAVIERFSYFIYKDFMYEELVSESKVSPAALERFYDETERMDRIVEISSLESKGKASQNYLTAPIRGLLSLLIILCGIAAAMYYLKDVEDGKYDWLPRRKHIIPAFAQCLSAIAMSSVAVFVALMCMDVHVNVFTELLSILLFAISATGFCLVLCMLYKKPGNLGATIPAMIIAMLILSPIFFNMIALKPIRLMLPTHYYLNSIYEPKYYLYFMIYIFAVYGVALLLNLVLRSKADKPDTL